jgi:hypothetical protein
MTPTETLASLRAREAELGKAITHRSFSFRSDEYRASAHTELRLTQALITAMEGYIYGIMRAEELGYTSLALELKQTLAKICEQLSAK